MKTKELGQTGLKVSEVCLGTMTFGWRADVATSFAILDAADEAGITFIDTANVYPPPSGPGLRGRSEAIVGQWLRRRGARMRIVVATKVGRPMGYGPDDRGLGRTHILRACEDSLRRLQTDYIDLYQTHAPDPEMPVQETLRALDDLVQAGKVRYVGCSNYAAGELARALSASEAEGLIRFASHQIGYNLLLRAAEPGLLPLCSLLGVGVLAYSPLAGGLLTDERARGWVARPDSSGQKSVSREVGRLQRFLEERGKSLTQVALAWVLAHSAVTSAILGASQPKQLLDSLRGVTLPLEEAEWSACNDLVEATGA